MYVTRRSGFTLIEIMVAMAIGLIATTMVFGLFVAQQRAMSGQRDVVDMQDNGRIAMEMLLRDIRNAGFLVPNVGSIRIEDNCGETRNDLGYDMATGQWSIRTASNRMADGDIVGISNDPDGAGPLGAIPTGERCPNGSDRITVVTKPDMQTVGTCTPDGCLSNNSGLGSVLRVPCFGADLNTAGDCDKTMTMMGLNDFGKYCPGGGAPYATIYVNACNNDDPSLCTTLPIKSHQCNQNCPVQGAGGGNINCIKFGLDSFSGASWTAIGGDKDGASVNGFVFRTYQLLDVNQDGSTELVYSDRMHGALVDPSNVQPANWVVVATQVDDLQFAWGTAAGNFDSRSMYNLYPCAEDATPDTGPGTGGYTCLRSRIEANAVPALLRVNIVARSARRDRSTGDTVAPYYRGRVENNEPAQQPWFNVAAAPGTLPIYNSQALGVTCTAANFETCSGNGNAQGFKRRVYTEVVALRNIMGFTN